MAAVKKMNAKLKQEVEQLRRKCEAKEDYFN